MDKLIARNEALAAMTAEAFWALPQDDTTFHIINDPGHGWLIATIGQIRDVGVADAITIYSMRRGEICFLEEDLDAFTFLRGYAVKNGTRPRLMHDHINTPAACRRFPGFHNR